MANPNPAPAASDRPSLALDLFSDEVLLDPGPHYRALRDRAPAVWLSAHGVWALTRYDVVRASLRADEVLVSGRGVALNPFVNEQRGTTTIASDGAMHRRRRTVLMKPMMPKALAAVRPRVEAMADTLVAELCTRDAFDGIVDFARHLPVAIVSHLVGLPEEGRERMLDWAAATFNALGPQNPRCEAAVPTLIEMIQYAVGIDPAQLRPEGWAAQVFRAAEAGALDPEEVRGLLIDYIGPSLDTTILGAGHLLYLLGKNPEQFARVRAAPTRVSAAVHEALRLGSPVRGFTRVAAAPYDAGGVVIPEGERVLILYGAANRDERRYPDPERFDVTREARDHLAFGHGVHRCAGGHLAQLELESLLRAVVARVDRIEVGAPEPLLSNMLEGYRSFRASFHPADVGTVNPEAS
jgi:cytochrome P450